MLVVNLRTLLFLFFNFSLDAIKCVIKPFLTNPSLVINMEDIIFKHIFWAVAGAVTLGTTSHLEGTLLGATSIAVQTEATVNGRLLAQTAVTLQMNTVTIK